MFPNAVEEGDLTSPSQPLAMSPAGDERPSARLVAGGDLFLKNKNSRVGFFSAYCKRFRQLHKDVYKVNKITSFHHLEIAPVSILVSSFLHFVFLCIHIQGTQNSAGVLRLR